MSFPFNEIENKWKKYWEESKTYKVNLNNYHKKCYCLVMFPYPSADKLHLGHWFNYGPADTWARFKKMNDYEVFHPMGFDAFGLPAENYAVKTGIHPQKTTSENIAFIREQLKSIGAMYDWDFEVNTSDPSYYKWTQWLFLQLYKNNLAYRAEAPVNWCPSCQTVLANEQVIEGKCERCSSLVERKNLTQWFFRITAYAERLLAGLDKIEWPIKTKLMQKNWIGKSKGAEIEFSIAGFMDEKLKVFTTRPDTLFGATYMVLAPEHPFVPKISSKGQAKAVNEYIKQAGRASEIERTSTVREKTGVFTGAYAVNPVNNEKIPVWIADYVLMTYGTGAIMAVPAHDERDFEFAEKYNIPIRKVILEPGTEKDAPLKEAYTGEGTMVNSGKYDGMSSKECLQQISEDLEKDGIGKRTIQYKFRDWLVSRQRYWGAPIPMIFCDDCGEVPVPEEALPVILPEDVDFKPKGVPPLATSEKFVNTNCPKCGKAARREVDTMDTFVDSSWYFMRYLSSKAKDKPWDTEVIKNWMPVDQYIGGIDHATMHLLYARFFVMALYDMGLSPVEEPFKNLVHQGIIKGPDGNRMSKSRGNVINPERYLEKYGSDVLRCYLMFGFDFQAGGPWDDGGSAAINRFLKRIWRVVSENIDVFSPEIKETSFSKDDKELNRAMHYAVKHVTIDTERFHFNTAISRVMELVNELFRYIQDVKPENQNKYLLATVLRNLIRLIAPYAPHIAEELWETAGGQPSVFNAGWPEYDEKAIETNEITWVIQVNGKIRERVSAAKNLSKKQAEELALNTGRIPDMIKDKKVVKIIVVPQKLINIVVR